MLFEYPVCFNSQKAKAFFGLQKSKISDSAQDFAKS